MTRALPFALLALAIALRFAGLDSRGLWLDEYTSIEVATGTFRDILQSKGFDSHTPPFYYLVLHIWLAIFGVSEVTLRSFSAVCDSLIAITLYRFSLRYFSGRAAICALALYATSPFAIYFAQEGRMYSLLALLSLGTLYVVTNFFSGRGSWIQAILLAILVVCGLYTHYYYAFVVAFLGATTLVVFLRGNRALAPCLLGFIAGGLAFLPWIAVILKLAGSGGQTFRPYLVAILPYTFFRYFAGYALIPTTLASKHDMIGTFATNWPLLVIYGGAFGLCVLGTVATLFKHRTTPTLLTALPLLAVPILAFLVSLKIPMLSERYLSVVFPFCIALLAWFLTRSEHRKYPVLWIALLLGLHLYGTAQMWLNPQFGNSQWREAAAAIREQAGSDRVVFARPEFFRGLARYYLGPEFTVLAVDGFKPDVALSSAGIEPLTEQITVEKLASADRVWLIEAGESETVKPTFETFAQTIAETEFPYENGVRLFAFKLQD